MRFAGQTSKLATIINNIEEGLANLFLWATEYMGGTGDNSIELSKDFYDASINPQLIVAQIQLLDRAIIAKSDLRRRLREMDIIDPGRTDEEIDDEIEGADPTL